MVSRALRIRGNTGLFAGSVQEVSHAERFPMLKPKTRQPAGKGAEGLQSPVRVLVVEDDRHVRRVMEDTFEEAGYEVESAEGLETGLKLIQSREFDIIVADGRLRDGTGVEIADAAWERDIPTLIVTAYAFDLLRERRNLASYNVIQKPVGPAQLIMAVTGLLKLRQR
jgi:DNA-binding NtrC family response regulator